MKVICIDDRPGLGNGRIPPFKFGDVLTAKQTDFPDEYEIIEDTNYQNRWLKSRFIPLSEISEK